MLLRLALFRAVRAFGFDNLFDFEFVMSMVVGNIGDMRVGGRKSGRMRLMCEVCGTSTTIVSPGSSSSTGGAKLSLAVKIRHDALQSATLRTG